MTAPSQPPSGVPSTHQSYPGASMPATLAIALTLMGGIVQPVQIAINTALRQAVQSPIASAVVSFTGGTLLLAVLVLAGTGGRAAPRDVFRAPRWVWLGGLVGAVYVSGSVILSPYIGLAAYSLAVAFGQVAGSMVVDHFGWMGMAKRELNPVRAVGAALLLVALVLMAMGRG